MNTFTLNKDHSWQDQDFHIPRQPKSVCITRYGGFGDMIQMASVLPYFKKQGYHVTVNTTFHGHQIVRDDPNIDAFVLQDHNQVPRPELDEYWAKLETYFDKHIQLSECVEATLLAASGRVEYDWSKEKLHQHMNVNYLERIHELAGAPNDFAPFFYPTEDEERHAKSVRGRYGKKSFLILWSLAGSSVHKVWPYVDNVVAHLMTEHEHVKVIMVGDTLCQILEMGWEDERRVICKSGKWSIRKTLSMIPHMDLIIGTETGVLNSAGHVDVPKILLLSHSTHENLTKHWVDTSAFAPEDTACYPCHKLHTLGFRTCHRDDITGTSTCASNIGYDRVIYAIEQIIQRRSDAHNEYIPPTMRGSS